MREAHMLPSVEAQKAEEQFEVQVMSPSEGKSKRVAAFTAAESGPFDGGSEEGDGVGNLECRGKVIGGNVSSPKCLGGYRSGLGGVRSGSVGIYILKDTMHFGYIKEYKRNVYIYIKVFFI